MPNFIRTKVPGYWIADSIFESPEEPNELILLLHGYTESGLKIFNRLNNYLPGQAAILAPCGPFPIPQRKGGDTAPVEYEMGYSWYFYNFRNDEYIIDMESAIHYLKGLIESLKLNHLPLRVIGFSQGGYLAPFIGMTLPQTRQIIGIACRFLEDELPGLPHFRMDAIHGEKDEAVECIPSQESHRRLISKGVSGEFVCLADTGHRMTLEVREQVKRLLSAVAIG